MKRIALATLLAFTAAVMTPAAALAQPKKDAASPLAIPVTGAGSGAVFAGTFQLQRFANKNGQLVASGILTGLVTTATGTTSVARTVSMPVAVNQAPAAAQSFALQGVCDILHLDLGPLDLNVLGLQIDLSRIVLDITAETGAGNLLGNLLCAVTGLLDQPGPLATLLNQILSLLS